MAGVNKVIILGRLGKDPEMTYTPSGMAVCKFPMATSKKNKGGDETTSWHRCTAFGKIGEIIGQYITKGKELYIEGELQYSHYEKDGITRYITDIIVNQISFVGSNQTNNNPQQPNPKYSNHGQQQPDDDIPF
jgi:single-strand DNA-binding protein